jgi:hypothetical protein
MHRHRAPWPDRSAPQKRGAVVLATSNHYTQKYAEQHLNACDEVAL